MSTEPEALRLADWLEDQYDPTHNQAQAAAELRRLHAELDRCKAVCAATAEGWRSDMTTLRTAAKQALEALEWVKARGVWGDFDGVADALKAALAEPVQDVKGCDYCEHPLYAAIKCRVCGRVTPGGSDA